MGWECSTHGRHDKCIFLDGNQKERDLLEDTGEIVGWICLLKDRI
jgi:hypothetical protein